MLTWLSANIGTILVVTVLALIVAAIIIKLRKDKKKGVSSCGGNCAHCAMGGTCHQPQQSVK
ncbi:MAG: FeoB-associated Cys-rich membrane protein [Clostridia bacterium]|nr:FeoB-associated Cys-rich membrane protein [Clostridia bacterium]